VCDNAIASTCGSESNSFLIYYPLNTARGRAVAGNTSPRYLVLTMMHLGKGSSAVLCCDDQENVIPRLFQILKGCIGWEISRIGDLDVDL
jgi:hypothetical protein